MNKRILQFAEQVGSTHKQNLGVYQFYTNELEKFAELIVKECARVSERTGALNQADFERFAALVTAKEREECAKVAEEATASWTQHIYNDACMHIAAAIRARGDVA